MNHTHDYVLIPLTCTAFDPTSCLGKHFFIARKALLDFGGLVWDELLMA